MKFIHIEGGGGEVFIKYEKQCAMHILHIIIISILRE